MRFTRKQTLVLSVLILLFFSISAASLIVGQLHISIPAFCQILDKELGFLTEV